MGRAVLRRESAALQVGGVGGVGGVGRLQPTQTVGGLTDGCCGFL